VRARQYFQKFRIDGHRVFAPNTSRFGGTIPEAVCVLRPQPSL
jgi:hypothetical protein